MDAIRVEVVGLGMTGGGALAGGSLLTREASVTTGVDNDRDVMAARPCYTCCKPSLVSLEP